jgi:hypothetical protein
MPGAKRPASNSQTVKPQPVKTEPVDPRLALAQKYLADAKAKLEEEEASQPRSRRKGRRGSDDFTFSIAGATFLHIVLSMLGMTFILLLLVFSYHMLHINVTVGRVVGGGSGSGRCRHRWGCSRCRPRSAGC